MSTETNPLLAEADLPPFAAIRTEHVVPAITALLATERESLAELENTEEPDPGWLDRIERLRERLHAVWGPVAHLNAVISTPELRDAYNECLPLITEFESELGQNECLYRNYEAIDASGSTNDPAQRELLRQGLRDFRLAGVALPPEDKALFRKLMLKLAAKQADFEHKLMDATDAFTHPVTDERDLAGLPQFVVDAARERAKDKGVDGWLLTLDLPTYQAVMAHAQAKGLREIYYRAWNTRASDQGPNANEWDNSGNLEDILALRHRMARMLGFANYAEMSLATKMAESTEQVLDFLVDLCRRCKSFAQTELEDLERFAGEKLEPWDIAFYSERLKQDRFAIDEEELRAYFPLTRVLEGLFELLNKLYGLELTEVPAQGLWHETARKFEIRDSDGHQIGVLLGDFFARPNKRGGAWMDGCRCRAKLGEFEQSPIAYVVCNFAAPTDSDDARLTHYDIQTLFHEFGHALHHLLTEIDYPSLSGINGVAWDAVELPSQFLENYTWLPDVLKRISSHRDSGKPLPDDKIATLIESRRFLAALAMVRQLEFGIFDMRVHSAPEPPDKNEVQRILDETRREVAVVPAPAFNRFQCIFAHIFAGGYAAGYYSYLWAEVLAADAFAAFDEAGAFDRSTAERFRQAILAVGGSRDAMDSFVAFRGREPELEPLLRQAGIPVE